jgi:hypothetical protein
MRRVFEKELSGTKIRARIVCMRLNRGGTNKAGEKYHLRLIVSLMDSGGRDLVYYKSREERKILMHLLDLAQMDALLVRYAHYYGFDLFWTTDYGWDFVSMEEFDRYQVES